MAAERDNNTDNYSEQHSEVFNKKADKRDSLSSDILYSHTLPWFSVLPHEAMSLDF